MNQSNTVIIVQARMTSSRLPGKVLYKISDTTMLGVLVNRLRKVESKCSLVVATSSDKSDDLIEAECNRIGVDVFRGDLNDVTGRYYHAAKLYNADIVVRITADCPLIDPKIVDYAIDTYLSVHKTNELVTNRLPLSFPDGMDVDVFSFESLSDAFLNAKTAHQREHVIPYFFEEHRNILNFECPQQYFLKIRLTLDYKEDFDVISKVYKMLGPELTLENIIELYEGAGDVFRDNQQYIPAHYYDSYNNAGPFLKRVSVAPSIFHR
ncbi:spore coat protein [Ferrigenium kumadai]|uniref:Spore coat protein n=1 Tax=Ferrigenium kumadai TaxID=1682490 RepID=A0AAN1T111_9PROT|nr:glycosyltransferase family protein [Ferrigenium kumadai]BBJ00659.1 spore coat protein [Ferrigenium kumadai]